MIIRNIVQRVVIALTVLPSLPKENGRSGSILSRPRHRRIICGKAQHNCMKITAAPIIAENAVVDPRNIRPYS